MSLFVVRNKLAYPGRPPGIDPNHPLSNAVGRKSGFSGIANKGNFYSITRGKAGVISGTINEVWDGTIGPGISAPVIDTSNVGFTVPSDTPTAGTLAAIVVPGSFSVNQFPIAIGSGSTGPGLIINTSGTLTWNNFGGANGASLSSALSLGVPYFIAGTCTAAVSSVVAARLDTGVIVSATGTGAAIGLQNGTVVVANANNAVALPLTGKLAAAMWAEVFTPLSVLVQWASDPWQFWYPQQLFIPDVLTGAMFVSSGATVISGTAESDGVSTAAFVSTATAAEVAESDGAATASATGNAAAAEVASSTGAATAAAIGNGLASEVASSTGAATAAATSTATAAEVASSAGTSAPNAISTAAAAEAFSSTGAATTAATSTALDASVMNAAGTSTAAAVSTSGSVAEADGTSTAAAVSTAAVAEVASSTGASTALATGTSTAAEVASSTGASTVAATSTALDASTASSTGAATVAATSTATAAEVASSTAAATTAATSTATAAEVAESDGTSTAAAVSSSVVAGQGTFEADGTSSASATSSVTAASVAESDGTSTADATGASSGGATRVVGWPGRLRHTRKELEEKLKRQRANTFGRKWYEEYLAAQEAAIAKAKIAGSERQARVLIEAVELASEELEAAVAEDRQVIDIVPLLKAAANAKRATASIKHANAVIKAVIAAQEEADDEEAIMLLVA